MSWATTRSRLLIIGALLTICGLAFGLRCLHLLRGDHYFLVSVDSHYFHRMAQLLVDGDTYFYPTQNRLLPLDMFSGITYPLAVIARAFAWLTPVSSADALTLTAKLLPPLLGVVTVLLLYFTVSRLYGRRIGVFSAFAWAVVSVAVLLQSAGYLDRDCLSLPLVIGGVFVFYFVADPRAPVGTGRFNWVAGALAVLVIEIILYVEWGFTGALILLAILVAFFLLQGFNNFFVRVLPSVLKEEEPLRMLVTFARGTLKSLPAAFERSSGRVLAAVFAFNLAAVAFRPASFRSLYHYATDMFTGGPIAGMTAAEMQGMTVNDILAYSFLLIPTLVGIYICARRRSRADLLVLAWLSVLFMAGLLAVRLFLYATPAICVLSAVGLVALLDPRGIRASLAHVYAVLFVDPRSLLPYLRIGLAVIVIMLTVMVSIAFARSFASHPPTAVDDEWHDALLWLRDNTDQDAVIMTWWDYGYWVFDVAQRVPVVDNGRHPTDADADIARVYCTLDDSEAVDVMTHYEADYLVFSMVETRVLPSISYRALNVAYGDGTSIPTELQHSLYARSFADAFHSESGLERVYRSPGSSLAILKLV